jgi:hypothetical protein
LNDWFWPVSALLPAPLTGKVLYLRLLSYFKRIVTLNAK